MPTPLRQLVGGETYHIYNRSAGKKTIFHTDKDYNRFLAKMQQYKDDFPVDLLAFCIMPNHFHLLIRPIESRTNIVSPDEHPFEPNAQKFLHRLMTSYAKYYDLLHEEHSGRVFQGSYKSKYVSDDAYYQTLISYIHDNPVKAKLADNPGEWGWSSYHYFIQPLGLPQPLGLKRDPQIDYVASWNDFATNREERLESIKDFI